MLLDLSRNRVEGGFFLLKHSQPPRFGWQPEPAGDYRIVGTYKGSGAPIRDALLKMLEQARRRVFVASFVIGDDAVVEALARTAERLKGGVYVISALDEKSLRRGLQDYEEGEQESPEERRKNFERLTSSGVYVRGHESCHAKFAVVDDRIALIGSANFVTAGFEKTGEANVIVRNTAHVRQLARLFTELWYEGCKWEIPPGETYLVADRAASSPPVRPQLPEVGKTGVVWTNGPGQMHLLRAIQKVIQTSRTDLTLSSYSIVGMRENPHLLFDDIQQAVKRGVHVRLLLRQRNAWPDQMLDVVAAHDMGVAIYGDLHNHAKVAIADSTESVVFSANFDAKHGLDSGVEVGFHVTDVPTVCEIRRFIDHAISHAATTFVRNPTLAEVDAGPLAARWCKPWGLGSEFAVSLRAADRERFCEATGSGPVLYEQAAGSVRLYGGDSCLECDLSRENVTGLLSKPEDGLSASERLSRWLRSVRGGGSNGDQPIIARGFCSATLRLTTQSQ